MRRLLGAWVLAVVLAADFGGALAQPSAPAPVDGATVGRFLSLLQIFMENAAADSGNDPQAVQRAMDKILAGKNPEANRLMLEIFGDVPPAERKKLMAIGRSITALSRNDANGFPPGGSYGGVLEARKALHAMGLTYYEQREFLDAVKRGDLPAVKLFLAGEGVDINAKDARGVSAFDYAQRSGNAELAALLSPPVAKRPERTPEGGSRPDG